MKSIGKSDPNHIPKQRTSLDLAHRLLELADVHAVHVSSALRRDIMTLQDRVRQAMDARLDREVRSD
jgi:hypothetical protein